jgi:hypothetical protein
MIASRQLALVCCVSASALAGLAVWDMFGAASWREQEPCLVVGWPDPDVGELSLGKHDLIVRVFNPGGGGRRVVGFSAGCQWNICFQPKEAVPVEVPSGETIQYVVEVKALRPGTFDFPLVIYLDDHGMRQVETNVRGTIVERRLKTDGRGQ